MATIALALTLHLLGFSATPRLPIDVVFKGEPMPPRLLSMALEEVTHIWAAYGVDVQEASCESAARPGAVTLVVTFTDQRKTGVSADSLGSILFVEDSPRPSIALYADKANELVASTVGAEESRWTGAYREIVVGRTLGRALAHEIGHYLLRTREHSPRGLMRARQSMLDLMAMERGRFGLSAGEVTRLHAMLRGLAG
jgi:hypothetical protein